VVGHGRETSSVLPGARSLRACRPLDIGGSPAWEEVATRRRLTSLGRASDGRQIGVVAWERRERSLGERRERIVFS
jgi:hypothetical protein